MTAAVLRLGRDTATGEGRRVDTWRDLFTASGIEVHEITLLPPGAGLRPHLTVADPWALARGGIVPEAMAWPLGPVTSKLAALRPDVVVFVTARAYRPVLARTAPVTVLDFVDQLSVSYRDRSRIARGPAVGRLGYRALALAHRRFERGRRPVTTSVAAGYGDATWLGVEWVPVLAPELDPTVPPFGQLADLLFVGNLQYPPNVEAVRRLDRLWPRLPGGTTLVLAGRCPTSEVTALAAKRGWQVIADFARLEDLRGIASVAVAPLDFTAGIQNKVLDAAALGMAQVATTAALRGMAPGFPARTADDDAGLAAAITALLDDADARTALARAASDHIDRHYRPAAWRSWVHGLLESR